MSRLIIKNLPPSATLDSLKSHFSRKDAPKGTVTDIQLARRPDGTSRQFGFVGYKNEAEAEAARAYFDKTFIGMSRISVSPVVAVSSSSKKRKSGDQQPGRSKKRARMDIGEETNDQLDEFKKVMKPLRPDNGPSWKNEDLPEPSQPVETVLDDAVTQEQDLSDLEWMRKRMQSNLEPDPTKTAILQTSRLFVRNLSYSCTQADLQNLFEKYGHVSQAHLSIDPITSQSRGFAYITFADPNCAVQAYEQLDKSSSQGRLLHILPAVDKPSTNKDATTKKSLKEQRSEERKKSATKEFNWSMLYMNPDAVATSLSTKFSISKSSILNDTEEATTPSINPAVKLALAEAHIINETKNYLSSQGVSFPTADQKKIPRSSSIILVKNIPPSTESDVRKLFEGYGDLKRVIVPPAGTMAIVEFGKEAEAKDAFRGVAYQRMGGSVVYLEWGWVGMFDSGDGEKEADKNKNKIQVRHDSDDSSGDGNEEEVGENSTVYIKNLSFSTTSERLVECFKGLSGCVFAKVMTKPNPSGGQPQSMGYGFIGFRSNSEATKALSVLEGYVLDGHALQAKFAARGNAEGKIFSSSSSSTKKSSMRKQTTKMIIKNLPFEVSKKDLRDLFSSSGHPLKSLRLPRKSHTSRSRGFAFIDFTTRVEAEQVMEEMKHVHLLGRHLVFEWGEEDDQVEVDEIRRRTGLGFGGGEGGVEVGGRKTGFLIEREE